MPPLLAGLGIAFLIIWFTPNLRSAVLPKIDVSSRYSNTHMSFADAVEKASPAVVTIFSEGITSVPRFKRANTTQELGSGVIMSNDGYILTNYHVVNNADQIMVILTDGRIFNEVQVIGFDTVTDLALLKIDEQHLPVIPMDDTFNPRVGDVVLAIGNPLNLGQTITQGVISATGKKLTPDNSYSSLLQMDAAVNVGNSGGALINSNGTLVGLTSAQFRTRYNIDIQGISFAIPYSLAKEVMEKLKRDGRVVRGYLGFTGNAVDSTGKVVTDLYTKVVGLRVNNIDPLGPAWQSGMQDNDIIVKVAGNAVTNPQQTLKFIGNTRPGTILEFEAYRNTELLTFQVTVAKLESRTQ
ncbi:serine protease DegS [Pseudoalteromonas aurantia 208]|uniref:Serine protease DegS n=2 Tax=Pseudoalteromonas TaxID=53246 RepID=A0ABR9E752_9GAMM|nr:MULTISPECIES: trypsin-like peptidase domain-containing protein [unclassified Pseudoalteromonas]MBE0366822.1 serine protease DegS [Pseudoalteromonas aurantia 208]